MKKISAVIALSLGLVAASGVALVRAQDAPVVLTNANGDCVTTGSPGNWTITCGDINAVDGQSVVVAPPADTANAAGDSGTSSTLTPDPVPVAAPEPDTSADMAPTETAVATETDQDADNYPDALEAELGLDPSNADTDGDGVADGDELNLYSTEPLAWDTDSDGISDGEELFGILTDPLAWDDLAAASPEPAAVSPAPETTTAPLTTSSEAAATSGGGSPDADSDAIADVDELNIYGTDPTLADTDGDGIIDGTELFDTGTDPLVWDSDGDGVGDGESTIPTQ